MIQTERLYLRKLSPDDLDELYLIFSDPEVLRYLASNKPATREETSVAIVSIIDHWKRHGFGRWGAVERATNQLIGFGGLRSLFGTPEVVYHFAPQHWGRGLATELAEAALRYGFTEHRFDRIVAITHPENKASIRVMQKIGMNFEKIARYYDIDVVQYEIRQEGYIPSPSTYLREPDSSDHENQEDPQCPDS